MVDKRIVEVWKTHLGNGWAWREVMFGWKQINMTGRIPVPYKKIYDPNDFYHMHDFNGVDHFLEYLSKYHRKMNFFCGVYGLIEKPAYPLTEKETGWSYDEHAIINTVFLDFDNKIDFKTVPLEDVLEETKKVVNFLRGDAIPRVYFSGSKGFHVYLDLPVINLTYSSEAIEKFGMGLKDALKLKTLDCIGETARLGRFPYTMNYDRKTGEKKYFCVPIPAHMVLDATIEEILKVAKEPQITHVVKWPSLKVTEYLQKFDDKVREEKKKQALESFLREFEQKKWGRRAKRKYSFQGMRSCLKNALNQQLNNEKGHLIRLAIALEMKHTGYSLEETINAFKTQEDFDYKISSYQVGRVFAQDNKPFKCKTIEEQGFCDRSCSKFKAKGGAFEDEQEQV